MAAIGVDYDFASGQAGVAVRSADNEFAGGVDVQRIVVVEQRAQFGGNLSFDAGYEYVAYVAAYGVEHLTVGLVLRKCFGGEHKLVVLCRHNDGVDAHRAVVFVIFHCYLRLGVRAQISHLAAFAAYFGEFAHQSVAQRKTQRYVEGGLVAGVAEHHALVSGSLLVGVFAVDAAVDVGRLLVECRKYAAGFGVEHEFGTVVANAVDYAACHCRQVDVGLGGDFAGDYHLTGGDEGFACHFRLRVESEKVVEDSVGNLVGHFVGMAFRHRF